MNHGPWLMVNMTLRPVEPQFGLNHWMICSSPIGNLSPFQAEPVYELEKKGHTSVIRVSYPLPSEPSVTFPTLPPSAAQDTPPIPPARRNAGAGSAAGNVPAAAASMVAGAAGAASAAMPPQLAKFPTLQIRADSQMGLDNFKFCTVLGRGHFGKVRSREGSNTSPKLSRSLGLRRSDGPFQILDKIL